MEEYYTTLVTIDRVPSISDFEILSTYGRMKHGDAGAIRFYAELLMRKILDDPVLADVALDSRGTALVSAPFAAIPSPAHYITLQVVEGLHRIHRDGTADSITRYIPLRLRARLQQDGVDYANLDVQDRRDYQRKECRFIVPADRALATAERILAINDARITGSQDSALAERLAEWSNVRKICWVTVVAAEESLGCRNPGVEASLNRLGLSTSRELIACIGERDWMPTVRSVRRALGLDTHELQYAIEAWGRHRVAQILALAKQEGFQRRASLWRGGEYLEASIAGEGGHAGREQCDPLRAEPKPQR